MARGGCDSTLVPENREEAGVVPGVVCGVVVGIVVGNRPFWAGAGCIVLGNKEEA